MKKYQDHLLFTFSGTLITLGFATIAGFWYVMSWYGAAISTIFAMIGMSYWQVYGVRIYNEMKFVKPISDFEELQEPGKNNNVTNIITINSDGNNNNNINYDNNNNNDNSTITSSWKNITGFGKQNKTNNNNNKGTKIIKTNNDIIIEPALNPLNYLATTSDANFSNIVFEKTIDLRIMKLNSVNKWSTRYIIITTIGNVFIYKSLEEYKTNMEQSVCKQFRPIELTDYSFKIGETSDQSDLIYLTPLDNYKATIELKCLDHNDFKKLINVVGALCTPSHTQ